MQGLEDGLRRQLARQHQAQSDNERAQEKWFSSTHFHECSEFGLPFLNSNSL
jgi:hypothetical protein